MVSVPAYDCPAMGLDTARLPSLPWAYPRAVSLPSAGFVRMVVLSFPLRIIPPTPVRPGPLSPALAPTITIVLLVRSTGPAEPTAKRPCSHGACGRLG